MLRLVLQNEKRLIPETAIYLSHIARETGVSEKRLSLLCFLLESALEKRMDNLNEENPFLIVELLNDISEVSISITDKGTPYVLTANEKKILKNGVTDLFKLEQIGTDGQRFTLRFRHPELKREEPVREELPMLDQDLSCSFTAPDEEGIIEAIRCIYAVYGYDYAHPRIYQIEHFRNMLNSGKYVSMLCRNAHGQIAGHVALDESDEFPGLMEYCSLVVKSAARGMGAAGKLTEAVLKAAETKSIKGLFSRPVMHHTATQKIMNRYGFLPCGICFNALGTETVRDKEIHFLNTRLHIAFCVRIFDLETEHVLFLPDECGPFILDIFDRAKMNYRIAEKGKVSLPHSKISYEINTTLRTIFFLVNSIGDDYAQQIGSIRNEMDTDKIDSVLVFLNMNDPGCTESYSYFRSRGYVFTGCLPGSSAGDFILLEDLKGKPVAKETIVTEAGYDRMIEDIYRIMGRSEQD